MEKLNEILHELGISKVKLAKFLGVSRQMIYNYLELDDINKWPKDKKVLLFNLLGIKSADELNEIKVTTDYIIDVEARIDALFHNSDNKENSDVKMSFNGLGKREGELLHSISDLISERLSDPNDKEAYTTFTYLHHFIQALESTKELKYMLGYVSKAAGFTKPLVFAFDENEQFIFESILFSAMTLYNNGTASKTKLAVSHKRFVDQIEHKLEEKLSRTLELNSAKVQALKELGYTEINEKNAAEVLEKIAEIQSRNVLN